MVSDYAIDDLCVAVVVDDGIDRQNLFRDIVALVPGWPRVTMKAVPQLPMTANGKLSRAALRRLFQNSQGALL